MRYRRESAKRLPRVCRNDCVDIGTGPCEDSDVVSPRTVLDVKAPDGPRWDLALELLERGQGAVGLGGLTLRTDPATPKTGRLFHIEFPCPADPALSMESRREQLHALGNHDLENARRLIESLCQQDDRFAALVAEPGVVYEFVHDYGMGTFLVATARRAGPLDWK